MRGPMPSRRWCRDVLAVRAALEDLAREGFELTDSRVLALSRRLDRLALAALRPGVSTLAGTGSRGGTTPLPAASVRRRVS